MNATPATRGSATSRAPTVAPSPGRKCSASPGTPAERDPARERHAQTVASETGAQVLTLDPADGLSDAGAGADYLDIMRTNLQTLREGQGCS